MAEDLEGVDFDPPVPTPVACRTAALSTLSRLCGQLLSVGFDGTTVPDELRARIAASAVGGVMLFRPNIASAGQVAALVGALRGAAPDDLPLLVSIDQEGGLVDAPARPRDRLAADARRRERG